MVEIGKKRVKREYIERGSKSVVKRGKECIKRRNYGKGIKMFLCKQGIKYGKGDKRFSDGNRGKRVKE